MAIFEKHTYTIEKGFAKIRLSATSRTSIEMWSKTFCNVGESREVDVCILGPPILEEEVHRCNPTPIQLRNGRGGSKDAEVSFSTSIGVIGSIWSMCLRCTDLWARSITLYMRLLRPPRRSPSHDLESLPRQKRTSVDSRSAAVRKFRPLKKIDDDLPVEVYRPRPGIWEGTHRSLGPITSSPWAAV